MLRFRLGNPAPERPTEGDRRIGPWLRDIEGWRRGALLEATLIQFNRIGHLGREDKEEH